MTVYKIPYFNFAALMILGVILLSAAYRKTNKLKSTVFFNMLVIEILLTTVFDIYAVYYDNHATGAIMEKYIFHGGYLILHTASAFFYLIYIISLTDTYFKYRERIARAIVIYLPMLLYIGVFIAGFYDGFPIYYIDAAGVYHRGPALAFGYLVGGFYLIYGIIYIMKYRKLFTIRWLLTLFSFYPMVLAAMVIEYFEPTYIIELLGNALSLMFIALHIQKPEELSEPISLLGNTIAFDAELKRNFFNDKEFAAIVVEVKNYSSTLKFLNYDDQLKFRESIGRYFRSINEKYKLGADAYIGEVGRYYVTVPKRSYDKIDEVSNEILEHFNGIGLAGDLEVSVQSAVCVVKVPDDMDTFETFRRFVVSDMTEFTTEKVVYAHDLLKREYYKVSMDVDKIIGDAIARERLQMFYQPIYSVEEKKFVAAEALMRISDPAYGMVSPAIFIPAAERSGAIYQLWDYALNEVCKFIASDAFKLSGIQFIDVNMSAVQCMKSNLAEETIATIDKYGIPHDTINIEITETAFAYDKEMLMENAMKLSEAGIAISLDDYGTGYSDIGRVLSLPLKVIKLDRSFVLFAEDVKMKSVVEHTIRMFQDVKMFVIAEGVEDQEIIDELTEMGCIYYQGWHYSKALPERTFIKFLDDYNKSGSF